MKTRALEILYVMAGGSLGSLARVAICDMLPDRQIFAILLCNIAGTFLYALVAELEHIVHPRLKKSHNAGFCGGLTTFSAFALQDALFFGGWNIPAALALLAGTFSLCVLAALAAMPAARLISKKGRA